MTEENFLEPVESLEPDLNPYEEFFAEPESQYTHEDLIAQGKQDILDVIEKYKHNYREHKHEVIDAVGGEVKHLIQQNTGATELRARIHSLLKEGPIAEKLWLHGIQIDVQELCQRLQSQDSKALTKQEKAVLRVFTIPPAFAEVVKIIRTNYAKDQGPLYKTSAERTHIISTLATLLQLHNTNLPVEEQWGDDEMLAIFESLIDRLNNVSTVERDWLLHMSDRDEPMNWKQALRKTTDYTSQLVKNDEKIYSAKLDHFFTMTTMLQSDLDELGWWGALKSDLSDISNIGGEPAYSDRIVFFREFYEQLQLCLHQAVEKYELEGDDLMACYKILIHILMQVYDVGDESFCFQYFQDVADEADVGGVLLRSRYMAHMTKNMGLALIHMPGTAPILDIVENIGQTREMLEESCVYYDWQETFQAQALPEVTQEKLLHFLLYQFFSHQARDIGLMHILGEKYMTSPFSSVSEVRQTCLTSGIDKKIAAAFCQHSISLMANEEVQKEQYKELSDTILSLEDVSPQEKYIMTMIYVPGHEQDFVNRVDAYEMMDIHSLAEMLDNLHMRRFAQQIEEIVTQKNKLRGSLNDNPHITLHQILQGYEAGDKEISVSRDMCALMIEYQDDVINSSDLRKTYINPMKMYQVLMKVGYPLDHVLKEQYTREKDVKDVFASMSADVLASYGIDPDTIDGGSWTLSRRVAYLHEAGYAWEDIVLAMFRANETPTDITTALYKNGLDHIQVIQLLEAGCTISQGEAKYPFRFPDVSREQNMKIKQADETRILQKYDIFALTYDYIARDLGNTSHGTLAGNLVMLYKDAGRDKRVIVVGMCMHGYDLAQIVDGLLALVERGDDLLYSLFWHLSAFNDGLTSNKHFGWIYDSIVDRGADMIADLYKAYGGSKSESYRIPYLAHLLMQRGYAQEEIMRAVFWCGSELGFAKSHEITKEKSDMGKYELLQAVQSIDPGNISICDILMVLHDHEKSLQDLADFLMDIPKSAMSIQDVQTHLYDAQLGTKKQIIQAIYLTRRCDIVDIIASSYGHHIGHTVPECERLHATYQYLYDEGIDTQQLALLTQQHVSDVSIDMFVGLLVYADIPLEEIVYAFHGRGISHDDGTAYHLGEILPYLCVHFSRPDIDAALDALYYTDEEKKKAWEQLSIRDLK